MSISTAFHVTRTGMQLQEMHLAVKAQNIAAQGADGYKKQYLVSYDLPYQDRGGVGSSTSDAGTVVPTGLQIGLGVQPGGIYRVFTQGDPIQTGGPLDVMIEGDGFFEVSMPDGTTAYTRIGALQKDSTGQLVMPKTGYTLASPITIPSNATDVQINASGIVTVKQPGSTALAQIGTLQLSTFINPSGLKAIGDSLYVSTGASGSAATGNPGTEKRGVIKHGYREGSNVNAVEEITDLIKIEKLYDMLTKVLKTGEAMMESGNRLGK